MEFGFWFLNFKGWNIMFLSTLERQQIDLLKGKTPAERFLMMAQLISGQFEAMKAGVRYKNPGIGDEELEECLKARMIKIYSLKQ